MTMKDAADNKTIDAFEKKPMTAAERQRKYREKNKEKVMGSRNERIDTMISGEAYTQLDCLLKYFALQGNSTKKEVLERLIAEEYKKHVNNFPADLFND
jgi:hypothetical protein